MGLWERFFKPASSVLVRLVLDVLCIILAYIPFKVLEDMMHGRGGQFIRGFYCDDESLRYPYHDDTVTVKMLLGGGYLIPISIIIVTELVRYCFRDRSANTSLYRYSITSTCSVPIVVAALYNFLVLYLFCAGINLSITEIGKVTIGRPRPHFIDACRPDLEALNCTSHYHNFVYYKDFKCTATNAARILDSRLSFPSGHSSVSWMAAIFSVCYLQYRFTWRSGRLIRLLFQGLLFSLAFFVCLSRISDYKHHWSDVLSGSILGTLLAFVGSYRISNMLIHPDEGKQKDPEDPRYIPGGEAMAMSTYPPSNSA